MQTRPTLAVVDDSHFYANRQSYFNAIPHGFILRLTNLLDMMEQLGLTHVWIVAGTELHLRLAGAKMADGWIVNGIGEKAYSFLSARHEGQRHEDNIYVGFPEFSGWPWKNDDNSKTLLATLTYLEDALGLPLEWTAPHMTLEYVKKLNLHRWSWWQPLRVDLEEKTTGVYEAVSGELNWPPAGQALEIPAGATHRIRIDINSDYAAGLTSLNIGEGDPKLWEGQEDYIHHSHAYDGKRPGFWKVRVYEPLPEHEHIWNGERLPSFADCAWMTTDMVEQLRRSHLRVIVDGGWYWEKYHQALRSTAEALWELRSAWRERAGKSAAHANVYETLRVIIKAIHGSMARPGVNKHFRRRDIWAMTVAKAVARRIYWIEKIYREFGLLPRRIKVDELEYDVSDPHLFDGMLGTEKLGGFKLVEIVEI